MNLGTVLDKQGRLDEAVACMREAVRLRPDFPEAHNKLGSVFQKQRRSDEAAACCREALRLRQNYPEAHHNLGTALKSQGRLDEAVACFRAALRLRPDYAEAHNNLGNVFTIQGLLEMAGIPYVGCGVLASSCGMDKAFMKTLFHDAGLPICKYVWFLRSEWENAAESVVEKIESRIGFPCFVKPANLGSSVGVSKATDPESLARAIDLAAEYDRKIIIERGLDCRERQEQR